MQAARGPLAAARVQRCGPAPPSALHRARRSWRCSPGPGRRRAGGPGPHPHRGPPLGGRRTAVGRPAHIGHPLRACGGPPSPNNAARSRKAMQPAAGPAQRPARTLQRRPGAPRLGGKGGCDGRLPCPPSPYLQHAFVLLGANVYPLEGQRRRSRPPSSPRRSSPLGAPFTPGALGASQALSSGPVCTGVRAGRR